MLKKCNEFKNRLIAARQPANVTITVLKNADHGFDENYPKKLWPDNQEVENCYALYKSDGTLENPFLRKMYKGENAEKQLRNECMKYGQYSGHNGDPKIGDRPMLQILQNSITRN